jgi:flagellar hook-associated protein 3 FlgL
MELEGVLKSNDQYVKNIEHSKDWLNSSESALNNGGKVLQRGRELALYGANGSLSTTDRKALANEVDELHKELMNIANTKLGDRHLFSGQKTDTPAFAQDGTFQGDTRAIEREIGPDTTMQVNANGKKVFEDAIDRLDKLKEHLNNEDETGLQEDISELDKAIDLNVQERTQIGAKVNRLDLANNRIKEEKIQTQELLSKNEDVDIAKTITNLKMQESVYRASLSVGARVMQPTLVDFIK